MQYDLVIIRHNDKKHLRDNKTVTNINTKKLRLRHQD